MKIIKYSQFINEDNYQDTPEEYVKTALIKLKKKIDSFFEEQSQEESDEKEVMTMAKAKKKGEEKKKEEGKLSFKELNVNLESSELSKYSAIFDSITIKYSDPEFLYNLFITISLSSGINPDKTKDFSDKEIKECSYKFKKYDVNNFELLGQIGPKTIEIDKIDEEFLVNLKIELDDEYGGEEEELEFET
jgi:hypothetical protein